MRSRLPDPLLDFSVGLGDSLNKVRIEFISFVAQSPFANPIGEIGAAEMIAQTGWVFAKELERLSIPANVVAGISIRQPDRVTAIRYKHRQIELFAPIG